MSKSIKNDQNLKNNLILLNSIVSSREEKAALKQVGELAKDGKNMKWWMHRFMFGMNLSSAIEAWLLEFKPSLDKPLNEQIPITETSNVVVAWMKFSLRRALFMILISSSITLITAFFLFQQIKIQDALILEQRASNTLQEKINTENKRLSYLKVLYDQKCESNNSENCLPLYNSRERAEALKRFIELEGDEPDLSFALLQDTNLEGLDFKEANLKKANLQNSILNNAIFNGFNPLAEVDLYNASIVGIMNIDCHDLAFSINWKTTYRNESLACGDENYQKHRKNFEILNNFVLDLIDISKGE